jgi:hypothetical protein
MMLGHLRIGGIGRNPSRFPTVLGTIQTTNNGATLTMPENRFKMTGEAVKVYPSYPAVAQVVSAYSTTQSEQAFRVGGGPGSFQACPPNVADGGPDPATQCANLPTGITNVVTTTTYFVTANGAPDPTANGATSSTNMFTATNVNAVPGLATGGGVGARAMYTAGPNQFGGTYHIFQKLQVVVSYCFNGGTRCSHRDQGTSDFWTPGGSCAGGGVVSCSQGGQKRTGTPAPGVITTGAVFGVDGSIVTPGVPKLTPNGAPELGVAGPRLFRAGWPLTTGVVRMDDNVGTVNQANPTTHVTDAGYDNRHIDGYVKLVGASFGWGGSAGATYPRATALWISLGAASVSGPGILVALGIFAGGYALRRKMFMKR